MRHIYFYRTGRLSFSALGIPIFQRFASVFSMCFSVNSHLETEPAFSGKGKESFVSLNLPYVLRMWFSGERGGSGLTVGHNELRALFQP